MSDPVPDPISSMVAEVNAAVTGVVIPDPASAPVAMAASLASAGRAGGGSGGDPTLPAQQAGGLAVQSVGQSMAIAVQDAVDLMRNIGTIETTAIGTATAKWIQEPENVFYPTIIASSTATLAAVAELLKTIGQNTATVLAQYEGKA